MNTLVLKEFLKVLLSNQAVIFAFTTSRAKLNIYALLFKLFILTLHREWESVFWGCSEGAAGDGNTVLEPSDSHTI